MPPEDSNQCTIDNHLKADVTHLHSHAEALRDAAGRTPKGRLLAVACTEIEKVKAFIGYNGL